MMMTLLIEAMRCSAGAVWGDGNYRSLTSAHIPAEVGCNGCPRTGEPVPQEPSRTIAALALNLPLPSLAP